MLDGPSLPPDVWGHVMPFPARQRRASVAAGLVALATALATGLATLLVGAAPAGADAPANDDLANATPISLGQTIDGDTDGKTLEPGEAVPTCGEVKNTIWYRVDAPVSGPLVLATASSTPRDTVLAVYTQAGQDLTEVACNDDGGGNQLSRVRFTATSGTTYLVQVSHHAQATTTVPGPLQLRLEVPTTTVLTASSSAPGQVDLGVDVDRTGGDPATGDVVVRDGGVTIARLGLSGGAASRTLERQRGGSHTYVATFEPAGTGESASTSNPVTVSVAPRPTPANDDFEDATPLTGLSGSVTDVDLASATAEALDPALFTTPLDQASVWYRWTAPISDSYQFTVDSTQADADPAIGVLLGDELGRLRLLESEGLGDGPRAELTFPAVGGRSYYLLVDAARRGPASLVWSRGPALADSGVTLTASSPRPYAVTLTATATQEPPGDDLDATAAFYSGAELLGVVGAGPDGVASLPLTGQRPGPLAYQVELYPTADAVRPSTAEVSFALPPPSPPANDLFENALAISGAASSGGVAGTTVGATADPGTPASSLAAPGADTTAWYRWTAPSNGSFEFTTTSTAPGDTLLRAFTGSTLAALRTLAENDDLGEDVTRSRVGISARAGQTYHLAVDGYDLDRLGPFTLTWAGVTTQRTTPAPSLTPSVSRRTVTLTARVADPASAQGETGLVEFLEGTVSRGVAPVRAGGVARLVLADVTPGRHRYQAVFVPDDYTVAQSTSPTRVVTVATPTRTALRVPARATAGSRPQIVVMVTKGDKFATGSVRITVNGRGVATRRLDGGILIMRLLPLPAGQVRIGAAYLGDTTTAPSSATRVIQVRRR